MQKIESIAAWLDRYQNNGWAFFNTGTNQKKCLTEWTQYQTRKPEQIEIDAWKRWRTQNYAIVCGEISNLIIIDVDTKNGGDPTPFLNRGFFEIATPSGGYHFYFKYNQLLKSTKHKKDNHVRFLKGIDIQSNKALVFAPPSAFPAPDGSITPYTVSNDTEIGNLPSDLLAEILDALEPEKQATDYTPFKPIANPENGRPGDIFNALATWEDILEPLGWSKVGRNRGGMQFWVRPGKKVSEGISASTNYKGYDLFFPYTKYYDELEQNKGYTKFRLYAVLNHGGDYKKAATALVMENYKLAIKNQ